MSEFEFNESSSILKGHPIPKEKYQSIKENLKGNMNEEKKSDKENILSETQSGFNYQEKYYSNENRKPSIYSEQKRKIDSSSNYEDSDVVDSKTILEEPCFKTFHCRLNMQRPKRLFECAEIRIDLTNEDELNMRIISTNTGNEIACFIGFPSLLLISCNRSDALGPTISFTAGELRRISFIPTKEPLTELLHILKDKSTKGKSIKALKEKELKNLVLPLLKPSTPPKSTENVIADPTNKKRTLLDAFFKKETTPNISKSKIKVEKSNISLTPSSLSNIMISPVEEPAIMPHTKIFKQNRFSLDNNLHKRSYLSSSSPESFIPSQKMVKGVLIERKELLHTEEINKKKSKPLDFYKFKSMQPNKSKIKTERTAGTVSNDEQTNDNSNKSLLVTTDREENNEDPTALEVFKPVNKKTMTESKLIKQLFAKSKQVKNPASLSAFSTPKSNKNHPLNSIQFDYSNSTKSHYSKELSSPLCSSLSIHKIPESRQSKVSCNDELNSTYNVNDLLLSSPEKEAIGTDKIRSGIKNLGQTCFIGSTLQLLYNTGIFRKHIMSLNTEELTDLGALRELHLLFKLKDTENVVDPTSFKKVIGQKSNRFAANQQEDVHEFLQELFSQLDTDFDQLNTSLSCSENDSESKTKTINNSVSDVFEWTIQNTVSCTECNYESVREDKCRDISVDFPKVDKENEGIPIDLGALLRHHFKEESVEYKCEKCPSKTAIIRHRIQSSPKVMILHLKRFAFDIETLSFIKRQDDVRLDDDLDLHPWCLDKGDALSSEFQLRCIVNHIGSSHNKGHYIADVLDPSLKKWRTYDDALMIKQNSDMTKGRAKTCYLLAYINTDLI